MSTSYKDIDGNEQKTIEQDLIKNGELDLLKHVKSGYVCCRCFMVYYNCLCCHEDL